MTANSPRLNAFKEGLPERLPPAKDRSRQRRVVVIALTTLVLILTFGNVVGSQHDAVFSDTGSVVGTVVDEVGQPVRGAEIALPGTELATVSAEDGTFHLDAVPSGAQEIVVAYAYVGREHSITVTAGEAADLGDVRVVTTLRPDGRAQ